MKVKTFAEMAAESAAIAESFRESANAARENARSWGRMADVSMGAKRAHCERMSDAWGNAKISAETLAGRFDLYAIRQAELAKEENV